MANDKIIRSRRPVNELGTMLDLLPLSTTVNDFKRLLTGGMYI